MMRELSVREVDVVQGGALEGANWVFTGGKVTIVNRESAFRALKDNTIGAAVVSGASGGPGRMLPAAMAGAVYAAYNINDHTRVVTPRITITEIPPDANINDQYGDS